MVSLSPPLDADVALSGRASVFAAPAAVPAVAALLVFCVVAFAPQAMNDGDTFWHLAAGQWMLDHHQVVRTDVFSYTAAGHGWIAHEWLSEVLMALAFRAGGWSGLVILFGLAAAATMVLLGGRLRRSLPAVSLACALVVVFACMAPSLLVRPHLLALPVLALWTLGLLQARDARKAPRLWLAALMALWANLHGGYVFGLALIAPFALEAMLASPGGRAAVARDWGLFAAASLAAALATPFGLYGLIYPFQVMTMTSLPGIAEWRPADFSHPGPLEVTLVVALFAMLWRGVRVPPVRLALLLFLLHMSLQHVRHQIVLAVVGVLLLAEPLAEALAGSPDAAPAAGARDAPQDAAATWRWAAGCVLGLLVLSGVRLAQPIERRDNPQAPVTALQHVPAALAAQPVFNDYSFGGYLIWRGVRPFIDGRSDMYGDGFTQAYFRAAGDPKALDALLARWKISWTILAAKDPAVTAMDRRPGWRRLYADRYAVVHVRDGAI